jgi:hypothetical protein
VCPQGTRGHPTAGGDLQQGSGSTGVVDCGACVLRGECCSSLGSEDWEEDNMRSFSEVQLPCRLQAWALRSNTVELSCS